MLVDANDKNSSNVGQLTYQAMSLEPWAQDQPTIRELGLFEGLSDCLPSHYKESSPGQRSVRTSGDQTFVPYLTILHYNGTPLTWWNISLHLWRHLSTLSLPILQIADIFNFLRKEKKLLISSINGYRSPLNQAFSVKDSIWLKELSMIMSKFKHSSIPQDVCLLGWEVSIKKT